MYPNSMFQKGLKALFFPFRGILISPCTKHKIHLCDANFPQIMCVMTVRITPCLAKLSSTILWSHCWSPIGSIFVKKKKIPAELSFFSVFSDMEKNKELRKIILANLFFSNSSQVTNTGEKTIQIRFRKWINQKKVLSFALQGSHNGVPWSALCPKLFFFLFKSKQILTVYICFKICQQQKLKRKF